MVRVHNGRILGTLVFGLVLFVFVPVLILGNVFIAAFPPLEKATAKDETASVIYYKPEMQTADETADGPDEADRVDVIVAASNLDAASEEPPAVVTTDARVVDEKISAEELDELFEPTGIYSQALAMAAATSPHVGHDLKGPAFVDAEPSLPKEAPPSAKDLVVTEAKPTATLVDPKGLALAVSQEVPIKEEMEQPESKEATSVKSPPVPVDRVWRSPSGKEIEGKLIRVQGETIEFRTKSGKVLKSSAKFFSEEDQAYIKGFEHLK